MSTPHHPVDANRHLELLRVLGRGGFGAVYLADLHGSDSFVQRVAVKVLDAQMSASADIAARQRDEARLLARLNHDHIVRVMDLTTVNGRPAVIMEHIEGADLAALVRKGPLPTKVALQAISQAASALCAAWESLDPRTGTPLRVVHRDIKPSNLLLSRHGSLKVLDFGIARGDFEREGATGSVQFGTTRFMAPEQWLYREVSDRVDVYALGVTLVELLAGAALERAPLAPEAFSDHMDAAVLAVVDTTLPPQTASALRSLLRGMLAFEPRTRPSARTVHEQALAIADDLAGPGLGRFARQTVPELIAERDHHAEADPLLSGAATVPEHPPPSQPRPPLPPSKLTPILHIEALTPADFPAATVPFRADPSLPEPESPTGAAAPAQRGGLIVGGSVLLALVVAIGGTWMMATAPPPPANLDLVPATPERAEVVTVPPSESPPSGPPEPEETVPTEAPSSAQRSRPERPPSPQPQTPSSAPTKSSTEASTRPSAPDATPAAPASDTPPPTATADATEDPAEAPDIDAEAPDMEAPSSAATHRVTLTSSPIGAQVFVDGKSHYGKTPMQLTVARGSHTVRITLDGATCEGRITVSPLAARTIRCELSTGALQAIR